MRLARNGHAESPSRSTDLRRSEACQRRFSLRVHPLTRNLAQARTLCAATAKSIRKIGGTSRYRRALTRECKRQFSARPAARKECLSSLRYTTRAYCRKGVPTERAYGASVALRGVTPAGVQGKSLVRLHRSMERTLETVIHEGLHRVRGSSWARSVQSGSGLLCRNAPVPPISDDFDDGIVQIFTLAVIGQIKKDQRAGRITTPWFSPGFSTTAYATQVAYVRRFLKTKNKSVSFLKKAYFGSGTEAAQMQKSLSGVCGP